MVFNNAVDDIVNHISEVDALMQQIGAVWNDRVAEHVSEELLAGIVSECNSFCSEMHSIASLILMRRGEMESLASRTAY